MVQRRMRFRHCARQQLYANGTSDHHYDLLRPGHRRKLRYDILCLSHRHRPSVACHAGDYFRPCQLLVQSHIGSVQHCGCIRGYVLFVDGTGGSDDRIRTRNDVCACQLRHLIGY